MEEDAKVEWEAHQRHDHEENASGGKVNWVLDKGLTLGKKILVTGFVITSAPIILPSLLVISAIGFICSVPYGIFLASYACTEKLMSKLLPCPSTNTPYSFLLGNGDYECGVTDRERGVEEGERGLGVEDIAMKDVHVKEREGEMPSKESDMSNGGAQEGNIKKEGMEKSGGGADDVLGIMITIEKEDKLEGNIKEKKVAFEVTRVAIDLDQSRVGDEEKKMARETIELIEKKRDEVVAKNNAVEDKQTGTPVTAIGIENAENGRESGAKKRGSKANKTRKGKAKGGKEFRSKIKKDVSPSSIAVAEGDANESGSDSSEGVVYCWFVKFLNASARKVKSNYAVHKTVDPLKITVSPAAKEMKHTPSPETLSSPSNQRRAAVETN